VEERLGLTPAKAEENSYPDDRIDSTDAAPARWDELDTTLTMPALSRLQEVRLAFHNWPDRDLYEDGVTLIPTLLPVLSAKKILDIEIIEGGTF
jgi:hypothetical protein